MRVTSQTLPSSLMSNLQRLANKQYQLQNEAASGKKTSELEDSPRSIQRLITLEADAQTLEQYRRNADHAQYRAQENRAIVRSLKPLADRASEIAVKVDPILDHDALANYATEVDHLLEEALAQANSQSASGYTFGGTISDRAPFSATRNDDGQITGVTYGGNQSISPTDIAPESTVNAMIVGANDTNSGPPGLFVDQRSEADFFGHLIALRDHLRAGDTVSVQKIDIKALEADEDNFLFHLSATGSLQARIELSQARLTEQSHHVAVQTSKLTDADLAETLVSLNQAQTAYQAALQSGAKILGTSLMDYIR